MRAASNGRRSSFLAWLSAFALSAGLLAADGSAAQAPQPRTGLFDPPGPDCATLAGVVLGDARIDRAEAVPSGDFQPPSGPKLRELPAFCRVVGTARPTPRSRIGFEVWLPARRWDGRVHMVGNSGYSSEIHFREMAALLKAGSVAVGTDTGHRSADRVFGDLKFGADNPDAIADWGHRAVHETIAAAKGVVRDFYGRPARYAYFSGCSTGGHQGLMEAQRYPGDFDGILAGAPGYNRTNLNLAFLWMFLSNHEPGDDTRPILDRAALLVVNRAVMAQCDRLDGVVDGVMSDPRECRFDPAVTLCKPGQAAACLSPRQVAAMRAIYGGPRRAGSGEALYPAWPVGSEFVSGQGASMGWDLYWANVAKPDEPQRVDYFRQWVFHDPAWNWWRFDWDHDVDRARRTMGPVVDAVDPDLAAFKGRGGKLILFSGWQDPVVSPYDVINYYDAVVDRQDGLKNAQTFARLFMVPGMMHCAGGQGATNFASSERDSFPLRPDPAHDLTLALEQWVEQGRAPDQVIAAKYANRRGQGAPPPPDHASMFPTIDADPGKRTVVMTRPLCKYPERAIFDRRGDPNLASSYVCKIGPL